MNMILPRFLTAAEAAHYLRVSPRTLDYWRAQGDGPPYVRITRCRLAYRVADLDAWADARTFTSMAAEMAKPKSG